MIDKLQNIILHYEELEQQMIDPTLINNQNKYKEVTREHRRLAPVIEKAKNYLNWQPVWEIKSTALHTISWYMNFEKGITAFECCKKDIVAFQSDQKKQLNK